MENSIDSKESFIEADLLKSLSHPHIIQFEEKFLLEDKVAIIMEYANNGDLNKRLKEAIKSNNVLPESQVLHWFTQLASAVNYLHSKKIIHRDIKLQNILLDSDDNVECN